MKNTTYQAGEYDQKIAILRPVSVEDSGGGVEVSLITHIPNIWAKLKYGKPGESFNFDAVRTSEQVTFAFRNCNYDLKATDTVQWNGVLFNIRGVPTINPRDMNMEIIVERGVGT